MEMMFNQDCLDFVKTEQFLNIVKDRKVVIVTDPPFNIGYHYNTYKDRMKENEYYNFLESIIKSYDYLGAVIVHYPDSLHKLSIKLNQAPTKVLSWCYNSNTPRQHRDIAYYGIKPIMKQVRQPYKNPNDKRIKERISRGITGGVLYDWFNINQVKNVSKEKLNHPCQMPLQVMKNIIGVLPKDVLVFDPFMGTGTTGIACKELGYDFIGTEIDEEYFKISKQRGELKNEI